MADNPADQETMGVAARFIAEAIDIHRDHLRPEDVELYTRAHAELDAELSAGSAQLQERVNWLEKDLRLYSDADEISAEDKERLLHYTKRIIDDSLELSAARSEYAAIGVLMKKGAKEGALQADQILNKGDLFAKLNISENLREWFGENVLAPAVARDFSDRKKFDQDMLQQVNSNIKTVERWNLAESDAHLSRYAARIKFYQDNKNAAAVKEAEDRYNDLARKLQRQTRELFSDQVLNGARSRGELQVLYRLADKPSVGTQPATEITEPAPAEPQIDLTVKPAPVREDLSQASKPIDTVTTTVAPNLAQKTGTDSTSGNETPKTGTETAESKTKDSDAKAGYETALQILHKKGLALNPDYNAEAAEPSLKSFVQYYLLFKPDDKIAPDDEEKLDGLILAAELYHRADGDFEKMTSNDLLEDVLFINPPKLTPPQAAGTPQSEKAAGATSETAEEKSDSKENAALVKPNNIEAFNEKTKNLNYDALIKQMGEQAHDGKLPVMDILALLDEELNTEKGYDHKLAKDNMREFIKATNGNPDREISLGDHNAVQNLARLAMAYKLANGDMKKFVALYGPGMDKEKATIDDSVSRFGTVLAKYHKADTPKTDAPIADAPKADTPAMSVVSKDGRDNSSEAEDSWFDPNSDVSWGRLGAIALGAVVLKKYLKSRSARRAAATPAATPAAQPAANAANNTAETPPAGETETAQGERPAQGADEQEARATRSQAGTEPEESTRAANGNNARRGQAQAVIDEGPSPEMDEINRKLLKLQQRDLKHREKKLEELKYERRKLKDEFEKSPEKSENDKKLLKMLKKDIEKKQGKIDTLRREIYDTERALEGRPRSRTAQDERTFESTRTQAERTVEAVRTTETAGSAPDTGNPPSRETGTTASRTAAQAPHEPESRSVLTGSGEQPHTSADGQRGITQSQEPFEDYMTRRMEDDSAKNITEAKPVERTAPVPETAAAETLNVLDDRDIPRPGRFGPTMDIYNGRSLYERGSALDKEKSFLQAEREQLIHQPSNSKRWKKHEEREERYKKDRQELDKDWEGYKQRGEQLTTEGKQLKAREDALNKEFADFEKNKSKLGPQELEARGRELMTERVKLHADSMIHSEQLAHYQGAQFSLISDRPAEKNTPSRLKSENPEPYADNTKNLAKAKKQLSKEYEKLEKESEKIEADEKKLKALKDKFTLPTDRPLTSSEEAKLKKIEDMQLEIDEKKARLKARETALGEHSDIYNQASETHEQRQKDLDAEQKKLYEKQEDLEKRSRLLEREKTNLKPKDYVEKSRALALEQDNLHTERTNLEAKRAAHHGENYSHTSARPGDVLKPWQPATPFNDVKFGRGMGMGFGTWSLFGRTMTIEGRQDFRDQFSTAAVGATADLTGIVADGAEIRQATKISQAAQESKAAAKAVGNVRSLAALEEGLETTSKIAGKVKTGSKLATPVAVVATVVSSAADFELGRRKGDAGRSAGATGAAVGGFAGAWSGALAGAAIGGTAGTFTIPGIGTVGGAAIGGIVGGVGGAIGFGYLGEQVGRMALTGTFSKWFGIDDALIRAGEGGVEMEVAKHYDLNKDGMLSLDEIKKGLEKNGIHSLSEMDTNRDGLTNEELRTALRRGLEGSAGLAKGQFSEASTPDTTLVGAGVGPTIDPMKRK